MPNLAESKFGILNINGLSSAMSGLANHIYLWLLLTAGIVAVSVTITFFIANRQGDDADKVID